MNNYYALRGAIILCLLGIMAVSFRGLMHNDAVIPSGDRVWRISMAFDVQAHKRETVLKLAPPWETRFSRIYSQNFIHPGFKIQRLKDSTSLRNIVAVSSRSGRLKFLAGFNLYLSTIARFNIAKITYMTAEQRELLLQHEQNIQVTDPTITTVLDKLVKLNTDQKQIAYEISDYVRNTVKLQSSLLAQDAVSVLTRNSGNALGHTRVMQALCRAATIPTRIVTGFKLEETQSATPRHWVEIYQNNSWIPFDVVYGFNGELPPAYIPLQRGSESYYEISDALVKNISVTITQLDMPKGMFTTEQAQIRDIVDLSRLPVSLRLTLSTLLLLPLGALITTFFRNIIGIRTFGTFIPTLLALSALHVDWITAGFTIFFIAVFGMGGRSLLPKLKLSKVPRLSIVLTLVVLLITLSISIMDFFNLNPAGLIILLPIIVLTTLVDRVYSVIDEDGIKIALIRLLWTMLVAVTCFVMFIQDTIGLWLLNYPEMHFFTIALIILFGQYRGNYISRIRGISLIVEPKLASRRKKTKVIDKD